MGGTRCTVAACKNSRVKTKMEPSTQHIKYHSFPKDKGVKSVWVSRCKRTGSWNPDSCHVCSIHFKEDDYERDLRAELLNLPPKRILKKSAVPTLHLGYTLSKDDNEASANRARRVERRNRQRLVSQLLDSTSHSVLNVNEVLPDCVDNSGNGKDGNSGGDPSAYISEINLWKQKCEELEKLIDAEKRLTEISMSRKRNLENVINQRQRTISCINKQLRALKPKSTKKNSTCKCVQTVLKTVFTESQCRMLLHDKKKLEWDNESMSLAFRLRYLSKRAYLYLSKTLNYPLPSLSSLRRWVSLSNGALSEPLNVAKTTMQVKSCEPVYTYKLIVA